jgi:hypothetical protein
MRELIESEFEFEREPNFWENLQHQITQKYFRFYSKIPDYHEKLDAMNFKLQLKESIFAIRKNFELSQLRQNYSLVVDEFEEILSERKNE